MFGLDDFLMDDFGLGRDEAFVLADDEMSEQEREDARRRADEGNEDRYRNDRGIWGC